MSTKGIVAKFSKAPSDVLLVESNVDEYKRLIHNSIFLCKLRIIHHAFCDRRDFTGEDDETPPHQEP